MAYKPFGWRRGLARYDRVQRPELHEQRMMEFDEWCIEQQRRFAHHMNQMVQHVFESRENDQILTVEVRR